MRADQLRRRGRPGDAVLLLLHGGFERSRLRVPASRWAPAWSPIVSLQRRAAAAGVETWALRHRGYGWNDGAPVEEAFAALAAIRAERPGVPVVVAGHSMGARTACRVADDPAVAGVVALAPWLPADDPVEPLSGKRLRIAYAEWDWVCPVTSLETFVARAGEVADVSVTSLGRDVHGMLRRGRWARFLVTQSRALAGLAETR